MSVQEKGTWDLGVISGETTGGFTGSITVGVTISIAGVVEDVVGMERRNRGRENDGRSE